MSREVLFSLDALKVLDFGKIGEAFQREVERAVQDCLDRPGEDKGRVVQLKFLFAPKSEAPGRLDCDLVAVQCEITGAIPKRRTRIYEMTPTVNGGLRFHPDRPDDPDGSTLFDDENKKEDNLDG